MTDGAKPTRTGGAAEEGRDPRASIGALRRHLLVRLAAVAATWAGVLVGFVLLLAWGTAGADGWSQGTLVPLVLHLILAAGIVAGAVAVVRWARRHLSLRALARSAGETLGLPRGSVLVGVELAGGVPPGTSPELAGEGAQRVARHLGERRPGELSGETGRRLSGALKLGGVAVVILAVPLAAAAFLSPERSAPAWAGVLQPYGLVAEPAYPALAVSPGDVEVERGGDVEVRITALGRGRVILRRQEEGAAARADTLSVQDATASALLEEVEAPIAYSAEDFAGHTTETFRVEPRDPLMLSDVRLHLSFPEHTALPPETHEAPSGALTVPAGTRIAVEGRANRPLEDVGLRPTDGEEGTGPGDGTSPRFEVDGSAFRGEWVPERSGRWSWWATPTGPDSADAAGDLPHLELELVPDREPEVRIVHPGREEDLPLSFRQPLRVEAVDDYGVERVELVARSVSEDGAEGEELSHDMDVGGGREARLEPVLDVSGWGLSPGDEVRYRARAVDNAPEPGVGESEEHVLRVPGRVELRRESSETLEGTAGRLQELEAQAREAAARARELERRAGRAMSDARPRPGEWDASEPPGADFQEEEAARQALEDRERILEELDRLRSELEELMAGLRDAGVMDADLQADLRELAGLLEDLASQEAEGELEEWRERLDEGDAAGRRDVLDELGGSQEALRDRLEATLERFRRAAAEEEFRSLQEEGRELAAEERELAGRFAEEADEEALAREAEAQEELAERAGELEEGARALEERLEAMVEPEAAERAREAQEAFREAREAMDAAARQAQEADGDGAAERAEQAATDVEAGLEQLDEAHQEMSEEWAEAVEEVLEEMASSALALSRRQGEISDAVTGPERAAPHVVRREEAALLEGARSLARSAREVAPMDPELAGRIAAALGDAMEAMEETAGALGGVGPFTPSAMARASSERAAHGLNQVALLALEGGGSGEGGQGGADAVAEALEQLDRLAEEQEQLAQAAGELMEMGPDQEGLEEGAQELGGRQEEVARGLDELGRRPGFDEGSLGDVESLEEEAAEIARELAEGRLDADLRDRQQDLFRRLLDAGRGIDQRGPGEHREGTPADEDAFERPEVDALDAEALAPPRFTVPTGVELEALPPAQRRLVVDYFDRLNRRDPGGEPPPEGR